MPLVCVRPLLVERTRETEDYARDKTDGKNAELIAWSVSESRYYPPERADETRTRLPHLGARRERHIAEATTNDQQPRDLLECAWPAVLGAVPERSEPVSSCTALTMVLDRGDGSAVKREAMRRMGARCGSASSTPCSPRCPG